MTAETSLGHDRAYVAIETHVASCGADDPRGGKDKASLAHCAQYIIRRLGLGHCAHWRWARIGKAALAYARGSERLARGSESVGRGSGGIARGLETGPDE